MTSNHTTEPSDEDRDDAIDEILRPFHYETFRAGICFDRDEWPSNDEEWAHLDSCIDSVAVGEHYEGWAPEVIEKLSAVLSPSPDDRMGEVLKTLEVCRDRFAAYTELHKAKGTPEGHDKALRNGEMVIMIEETLARFATTRLAASREGVFNDKAVMPCPVCEGEGEIADGLDEAACSMPCPRCDGNAWLVDLAALASPAPMPEGKVTRLRKALVDHNDALRSAAQVASRDGADTNWLTFRGHVHWTLAEHHETTNEARAALGSVRDKERP